MAWLQFCVFRPKKAKPVLFSPCFQETNPFWYLNVFWKCFDIAWSLNLLIVLLLANYYWKLLLIISIALWCDKRNWHSNESEASIQTLLCLTLNALHACSCRSVLCFYFQMPPFVDMVSFGQRLWMLVKTFVKLSLASCDLLCVATIFSTEESRPENCAESSWSSREYWSEIWMMKSPWPLGLMLIWPSSWKGNQCFKSSRLQSKFWPLLYHW